MREKVSIKARKGVNFKHVLMPLTYVLKYFEHQLIFLAKSWDSFNSFQKPLSEGTSLSHPCGADAGLCCALNLGVEISA